MRLPSELLDRLLERQHPVRTARVLTGLSLRDVELASGVSRAQLSRIERGEATATPAEEQAIAAALGLERWDLFPPQKFEADLEPDAEPEMTAARRRTIDVALRWVETRGRRLPLVSTDRVAELRQAMSVDLGWDDVVSHLADADFGRLMDVREFLGAGVLTEPQRRATLTASRFVRPRDEGGEDGYRLTDKSLVAFMRERGMCSVLSFPSLLRDRGDDQAALWDVIPDDERATILSRANTYRRALLPTAPSGVETDDLVRR